MYLLQMPTQINKDCFFWILFSLLELWEPTNTKGTANETVKDELPFYFFPQQTFHSLRYYYYYNGQIMKERVPKFPNNALCKW